MSFAIGTPTFRVDGPQVARDAERMVLRLGRVTRPIKPLVESFAAALRKSIDTDFALGGRAPFPWAPNRPNTIAAKGHGRILEGKNGPRMRRGVRVTPTQLGGDQHFETSVHAPFPGSIHQNGAPGPWVIRPKNPGGFLVFRVAEDRAVFSARRKTAQAKRRAGQTVKVPSRPGSRLVFARQVIHPGLPQRKFVVVRPGLLREAWYRPASKYLLEGVAP